MNTTEEIKSRIDIVDLVSETVKLRRAGKNYTGFCPFHTNTRTPAFVVFPDTGTWRCFGECNEGGDIFRFIMKKEGWDFPETLRYLAKKAGVTLEPLTPQKKEENAYVEKLRSILEEAVIFFRHHLTKTETGKQALQYLEEQRKLTQKTIETFELGYAPQGWDNMLNHFKNKGYSEKELLDCGLITKRTEKDGFYDRFRNRITFPIRDAGQRICGFGARVLAKDDIPKYLNSPQTLLFDKSAILYGLDKARKPIRAADQVLIVEGYFDVIGLHQAGFQNAVSPMGTALTPTQIRHVKRYTRKIIMALDPDVAGEKATLKGLEVARDTMDRSTDYIFDPRGLVRTEGRLDADIRVCALPDGIDPDEIALADPEEWQRIVDEAKPIITHVINALSIGRDLDDPKTKSEIAGKVIPLIKDVANAVERDTYRQQLARTLHIDEQALFAISETQYVSRRRSKRRQAESAPETVEKVIASKISKNTDLEKHIILILIDAPDVIYDLDRYLNKNGLQPLSRNDIESGALHDVLSTILDSINQIEHDAKEYIASRINERYEMFKTEFKEFIPEGTTSDRIMEELIRTLLTLRRIRINERIQSLLLLQSSDEENNDKIVGPDLQKEVMDSIKTRASLEKALATPYIND